MMIGPFRTAQVVSLTLIVVCSVAYIVLKKRANEKGVIGVIESEGESDADPR